MHFSEYPDMPAVFKSHSSGQYFERCISCNIYLLEAGRQYFIEKAIRKYTGFQATDVIFEYAMCMECADKMRQELSTESLQKIQNYFAGKVDLFERYSQLSAKEKEPESLLSHCIITGKPVEALEEYQVYAHCEGKSLLLSGMPYMISGEAMDEIADLLSEKTLGEIDRFIDENFGLPPELKKPIKDNPVIFI